MKTNIIGALNTEFNANITVEIGKPNANAVSGPAPASIAKAVPKIVPEIISGGMYAPIETAPINANSRVAPIIIPNSN